jgi:chemotaxis protein CheX
MMTTVSLKDALLEGAREVFETMVFMALEESAEPTPITDETTLLGTITFKGSLEGCLGICCGLAAARAIAAGMLGLESDESLAENDISDAVGEVANMVMGAVKSRIQDQAGVIEVSIPSVVQGRQLKNSLGDGATAVTVRASIADEHAAELLLLYRENENG